MSICADYNAINMSPIFRVWKTAQNMSSLISNKWKTHSVTEPQVRDITANDLAMIISWYLITRYSIEFSFN